MGVLDDAFKEATKGLDFTKRRDRARGGYVRRRAEKLLKQRNPDRSIMLASRQAAVQVDQVYFSTGSSTCALPLLRSSIPQPLFY
jgi:hypothetical protein